MPEQINASADFFVTTESDITGADASNTGAAPGTASTQPNLAVGYYNSTLPTVSNASPAAFQLDSSGRLLVNLSVALPAGTNNIGDVDVVSLPALPTGANSIGQVTANAGTNLNTSALALESGGNLATLAGTVSGNEMQVDIVTLPALPAGTNNIGDVDVLSLPALPAGSNSIGQVTANAGANLNTSALALETGGNLATVSGVVGNKTILTATGTFNTAGDNTAIDVSAVTGYTSGDQVVLTGIRIQNENGTANTVTLKDGSTVISRVYTETAGSGLDRFYGLGRELRLTADADFVINLSAANQIGYSIEFYLEQ